MVGRFFTGGCASSTDGDQTHLRNGSRPIITLLSGPPSCGKTSLCFQFALNCALADEGRRPVVFICKRRRLETKPPFLSQGVDPTCDAFQRIQMKYLDGDEGIKKYFAAFHFHETTPAAVVIDDFGEFFDERSCQERYANPRGRDLAMVRVLALGCDAMMHAKNECMNSEKAKCRLLLSDTHHGDSPRLLFIYKRWVSTIFTVKGDDNGSFIMRRTNNSGSRNAEKARLAKYSLSLQHLHLQEIMEDDEDY